MYLVSIILLIYYIGTKKKLCHFLPPPSQLEKFPTSPSDYSKPPNYSVLESKKCYVHNRGIFKTKLNIHNGAFSTLVKPFFNNVLNNVFNSIELPLGSIFYTTHSFVKTLGGKSQQFFFSKFEIMQCIGVINRGFLN